MCPEEQPTGPANEAWKAVDETESGQSGIPESMAGLELDNATFAA